MKQLEIKDFKAFKNRIYFDLGNPPKNMLLFGENGSGKTSVFEAIKLCFYRDRLLKPHQTIGAPAEQKANEEKNFYRSYNHRVPAGSALKDFTLKVNGSDFKGFSSKDYQCFMVSSDDLYNIQSELVDGKINKRDVINLPAILKKAYFPIDDVDNFVKTNIASIVSDVNASLKGDFVEDIGIGQENTDYDVFIKSGDGSLREYDGLHVIFNEAIVNLVILLLLLHSVLKSQKPTSRRILVLDDMVTSLDASNRNFLIEFVLNKFGDFQKIVLTHNIGFNNLFYKKIDREGHVDDWVFQNIYITKAGPQQYYYNEFGKAQVILDEFKNGLLAPGDVGNVLRKRFEAIIYELAKAIQVGEVHQATNLVGRMVTAGRPIYVRKKDGKCLGSDDLVGEIKSIMSGTETPIEKLRKIKDEIEKYASDADLQKIVHIIKEMHFYEKIMIHQLSHGATAMPVFNQKEVEDSLKIIVSLEHLVKQYTAANKNSWQVMM